MARAVLLTGPKSKGLQWKMIGPNRRSTRVRRERHDTAHRIGTQQLAYPAVNFVTARILIIGLQLPETRALPRPDLPHLQLLAIQYYAADIQDCFLAENVQ